MKNFKKLIILCSVVLAMGMFLCACGLTDTSSSVPSSQVENAQSAEDENEEAADQDVLNDNKSYFIMIDSKKFYAGDKISDLSGVGYTMDEDEKEEEVSANTYVIMAGSMKAEGVTTYRSFSVTPFNPTDSTIKLSESVIGGIDYNDTYIDKDEKLANFEVYGGIKLGSTIEEVKSVFGEPSMDLVTNEETGDRCFKYESDEVYREYNFNFDKDGKVTSISWQNLVFNE